MAQDASTNEILEAINTFSSHVDDQFSEIRKDVGDMRSQMGDMRSQMGDMRSQMVTKDYLDEKLADLRGDLVVLMRKEDAKLIALVKELRRQNILSEDMAQSILKMEPFPQLSL